MVDIGLQAVKTLSKQLSLKSIRFQNPNPKSQNVKPLLSRNPMIKKIRASREQVEAERDEKGVDIDPSLAKHTGYDGVWQPVAGTRHKFYVYSAFYDDRARPIVRVVAATRTKRSDKVSTERGFFL